MAKTTAPEPVMNVVPAAELTTSKVLDIVRAGGKISLAAEEVDGEQQSFEMLQDRANAESADALFGGGGEVTKVAEILGQAFQLNSVEFRNSEEKFVRDGSIGIYAVMHVSLLGKPETVVTGATDVIVKCLRATELDILPQWLQFTSEQTKGGFTVYNLLAADAPAGA